ncbi:diguanylate cyclase (GGDEF)-like protein [Devosia subaequoris]|uniref:Diguanylate cyclase (GGDEF)-like protein n=1 Tax=Devosia subaequoris TaxID=395930 RepID=A0A7W6ND57_9HYPH|nr:EAL domain-containing protein [Devosia subaequoris]MBB4053396.1 diguanylate cyclase (GGDEF)-like protein [Devosia subaequoris]MCP1210773.1 EAL domain-containing protein [Devosia subaequoris]
MRSDDAGNIGDVADTLLLDAALESIPYGFCVWSPQFRLVMWNEHYRDFYGFSRDAIYRGMTLEDVVHLSARLGNHPGQGPEAFYEHYTSELLANRGGARHKAQEIVRGGRVIETAHVYSEKLGWVVTHEDITDEIARSESQQKRKLELERQNIRLDAAVNNISIGLCMMDARGRLVICNEPYARIYNLPIHLLKPGSQLEDILGHLFDEGMSTGGTKEDYIAWRRDVIARREYGKNIHELNNRTILMQHHPMKDGGWVSTHEDITEQRQAEARIQHLARHDALTDLPNRIEFLEQMAKVEAGLNRGEQAAVLYIDLDHFKAVNDTLGHAVGDEVIKQAAVRLWGTTRETDLLARLGGDEFALLLRPVEGGDLAAKVADRIVKAMRAPMNIGGQQIEIGASVGIAVGPGDGTSTDQLVKNADLALYKAKSEGRSTYHFFETGMDAELQQRRSIEAGLRMAMQREELRLMFQPLLGLQENRVTCVEALLRWDHDDRTISPAEFVPVAEETGLIVPIGEWVLHEACKAAATWPGDVRVAVNLSPVQFRHKSLVAQVKAALLAAKLEPIRLELEITESLLLSENESTIDALHELRAMGVRVSLDDFGTGYSSLSYLRSFPFDKIKIDRSFMADLTTRADSQAIIKAVIGLGQSLGMSTTAEGVETEEQLAMVREHGASEVQGFLFSPPLQPAALANLLHSEAAKVLASRKAS